MRRAQGRDRVGSREFHFWNVEFEICDEKSFSRRSIISDLRIKFKSLLDLTIQLLS
jgi:hypothetical protein